ncbi:hypothetical protein MNBD_GAMMA06-2061 [hydrothermal vent metagenome]|uniref:Uncharacterized protein n=1 Tax=hydrothermal vent metagenome TaxID=652676 RepID=A0A3B0WHQ2_9ZZZZ
MSIKKKVPKSWTQSDKNIRAVQVIFELEQAQSKLLRINAIKQDLSPSDYIRDIIDLPRKKPVRPRLSISLSSDDYTLLAARYALSVDQKSEIRERIKQDLVEALDR